jgi:hypothetical protein
MLAAWVSGTDRNLFPLCRNTAFKLTFEESENKRHSVGSCWCPRASKHCYKISDHFLEKKIL